MSKERKIITLSSSELRGSLDVGTPVFTLSEDSEGGRYGTIKAYVSVYGNMNSQGFSIAKGAYDRSLAEFNEGKRQVHVDYMHGLQEIIGDATKLTLDDHGVVAEARIALYTQRGKEVFNMMKDGILKEYSVQIMLADYDFDENENLIATDVELTRFAIVDRGADSHTETLEVGLSMKEMVEELTLTNQEMRTQLKEQKEQINALGLKISSKLESEEVSESQASRALRFKKQASRANDNALKVLKIK